MQHHTVTSSGGVEYAFNPVNVSGTITITYEYTPTGGTVPEPASMILLASSLGVVALYRLRRNKKG